MQNPIDVMIVDDEILAIEDLQQLISWEKHGFRIVATATNAQKALELYEKHLPQIVFADIRMPVMDGLEFSRRVLAYRNPVKIILLTAYKEFEYAKQAVEIGVSNYLLKHDINEENLLKELSKVRDDLEQEFRKNYIVRQQLMRKLFSGLNINDWNNLTGIDLLYKKTERLGLFLIEPDQPYIEEFRSFHPTFFEIQLDFKQIERPKGVSWVEGYDYHGRIIVLIGLRKTNSQREEREFLQQLALNIKKQLVEEGNESFSIIIARGCTDIKEISLYLQRAIAALDYLVFFGREKILHCEDLPAQTQPIPPAIDPLIQNLATKIHLFDFNEAERLLDQVFQPVLATKNPRGFKTVCRQLFNLLEQYRQKHELQPLPQLFRQGELSAQSLYFAPDILSWFKECFSSSFQQVRDCGNGKYSKKVQQAMEYIQHHFSEDLTVESIAASLGISGVYLSQLFKKETNRTVLEYLTKYRIKIAKDLLENGDYKIYEVAEMVGYKTSQYFSQVFRKVTGTYPFGYKEGEGRHEARD